MDSVDVFAQEYDLESAEKTQLSRLIVQGFEKQRVLYKQLTSQEITDDEYKSLSAVVQANRKAAIASGDVQLDSNNQHNADMASGVK